MDQILSFGIVALTKECHHRRPSLFLAASFCGSIASAFVLSLYALVPFRVRRLDRDDPVQIQWRTFATVTVCLGSILVYPFCFCSANDSNTTAMESLAEHLNPPVLERTGIYVPNLPLWHHIGGLAHVMALYLGPVVLILVQARVVAQKARTSTTYLRALQSVIFSSPRLIATEEQRIAERWVTARNKVIAPVLEEVAFRGCMVPALVATATMSQRMVALVAPVFFGLAHIHHAVLKLQQGDPLPKVFLMTTFQFLYTSLFGAYSAYAFLRSRSLVAVILSHSFCNTMGLPSFYFLYKTNPLYRYRFLLMTAHLLGMTVFAWGFTTTLFLP